MLVEFTLLVFKSWQMVLQFTTQFVMNKKNVIKRNN